jgi:hypothetical protein
MPDPIADAQGAAGNAIGAAYGCMNAVWQLVVAILQYGDSSPQAESAHSAVFSAVDASDAISVSDPCPGTCGTGLSSAVGALQSAAGNSFMGSYDPNASLSEQASQAMEPYTNSVSIAIAQVFVRSNDLWANRCACDMEATGGANAPAQGCYNGVAVAGGPAPNTQWWHTSEAECPTWRVNGTPHQCQCYQDEM